MNTQWDANSVPEGRHVQKLSINALVGRASDGDICGTPQRCECEMPVTIQITAAEKPNVAELSHPGAMSHVNRSAQIAWIGRPACFYRLETNTTSCGSDTIYL